MKDHARLFFGFVISIAFFALVKRIVFSHHESRPIASAIDAGPRVDAAP
jgi:hypothetical protein